MKLPVLNAEGKKVRTLEVDDSVFGIAPNGPVLHQAFVAQRNNQRWGTAQTKTRGLVQGSTRKIRAQKYTGRARQGSIRAPHHVGGGIVFGPQQRSYAQALPKKMRRLAIRSALSGKAADGQLVVIDELAFKQPRTQEMLRMLRNVGIQRSALIVTAESDLQVRASARNLQKTKVLPAAYLNVVDLLNHGSLLMTEEAVRVAEGLWGRKQAEPAPAASAPKRRAAAAKEAAPAEVAEAPAEPVTAEPPAAEAVTEAPKAPRTRRTAVPKKAAPEAQPETPEARPAGEATAAEEAPKPRRRTRKAEEGEA